jgi:predicted dehydrogenase
VKKHLLTRRDFVKMSGLLAFEAPFINHSMANTTKSYTVTEKEKKPTNGPHPPPLTAIVLGAGNRGNTYAKYSLKFPDELKIVGVAEPIDFRRRRFSEQYNIKEKNQWVTWEHVLQNKKLADVLIITTPDRLHHGPAMGGMEMGYDLLLEKAIGINWEEVNDILQLSKKKNTIVGICHVLRYTNYFRQLKKVVDSGVLGELLSIEHTEKLSMDHYTHSYIRGNWRTSKEAAPMLLAKSCHDLDILRWIIGKPCKYVSSFGAQTIFVKENAPPGSTLRCTGGCTIETECHMSALKRYYKSKNSLNHLAIERHDDASILKALKEGPFGRCVWHCDNDSVDHQVVNMEFEDQITASFTLGFSPNFGRRTRVNGSLGAIVGNLNEGFTVCDIRTGETTRYNNEIPAHLDSGHGGGDFGLVHDFVRAVQSHDPAKLTSSIDESAESHLMGYKAEESRHSQKTMAVNMEFYK